LYFSTLIDRFTQLESLFFFFNNNKLYYARLTKIQIYLHMFKPEGKGKRRWA
jgi:hypothetical protein